MFALAVACSSNEPAPVVSATPSPSATPTVRHEYAFIKSVDTKQRTIRIDPANLLLGDEANQAAIKAGEIEAGDTVPNDYYIQNLSAKTDEYRVGPSATIRVLEALPSQLKSVTLEEFARFIRSPERSEAPYWVDVQFGREPSVISIEQQYRP